MTGASSPGEGFLSRLELIWGPEGIARLSGSAVLVFGVGGVGASCAVALVRGGVGCVAVVDGDSVQESNVNRQAIAFRSTVGRRKVEVFRAMAADINPDARIVVRDAFVTPNNLESLAAGVREECGGRIDYVVDAIDTVSSKLAIAEWAEAHGVPLLSSMGAAMRLHPERLRFADIYDTERCPLSRAVRKEARKRGIARLEVLYSDEEPIARGAAAGAADDAPAVRRALGSASFMPPIMGEMIAGRVICRLAGVEV